MYEIIQTVDGKWIILCNGFQYGGTYDASGAGNMEFDSNEEARLYLEREETKRHTFHFPDHSRSIKPTK